MWRPIRRVGYESAMHLPMRTSSRRQPRQLQPCPRVDRPEPVNVEHLAGQFDESLAAIDARAIHVQLLVDGRGSTVDDKLSCTVYLLHSYTPTFASSNRIVAPSERR